MLKTILIATVVLSLFNCLIAVDVIKIEVKNYNDFQKGDLQGTNVDSNGRLFIGPSIKKIKGPEREYYLSIDFTQEGDIILGTGHNALVYKIKPETGSFEQIFSAEQLDVYALAVRKKGSIIVGTSPNGKVYQIGKDKKAVTFFDPDEKFIWDIKEDNTGNIVCAVGNGGGVYRIRDKGDATKIFTAEDLHIISLYITRNNAILAGSGDRGILYKINNNKAKILFDSPYEEIKGICEDKDGNIYFSATKGLSKYKVKQNGIEPVFNRNSEDKGKDLKKRSVLYFVHTNGIVDEVWSSEKEYIYSLQYLEKDNCVLVGTGNSGRIYKVNKEGDHTLIYESDSAQIFKMKKNKKGCTIITNNSAAIANIESSLNSKGVYLSEIYDFKIKSRMGRIYWDATNLSATGVSFYVRAGNSNRPDKTWTDWSPPFNDSNNSRLNLNGYRYAQIKVSLNTSNITASPSVNNYRFYYVQANLKPRMDKIEISQAINLKSPKNGKKGVLDLKKSLLLKWYADDPNKDKLKYNVFIKKIQDRNWIEIKEDILETRILLRTDYYEDGAYYAKVRVDDSLSNPDSKSDTMISNSFVIDSTAPIIQNFSYNGNQITFDVVDDISVISKVLYSYDSKIWYPVFPHDQIADSRNESFRLLIQNRGLNKKIVFIKVMDEFKNHQVYQKELIKRR